MMMVPTKILPLAETRLFGWGAKIRMGLELFRRPHRPAARSFRVRISAGSLRPGIHRLSGRTVARGRLRWRSREMSVNSVLTRFVEIESKYGSLTRGVLATPRPKSAGGSFLQTLKGGLGQLVHALRPSADVVQANAETLEQISEGFRVRVEGEWLQAEHVVVATPAHDAAELLGPVQPELAGLLAGIPYTTSITLALGYRKNTFDHPLQGHGFLVPKKERKYMFGCTWVGNKFDYRVPPNMVVLRCFLGAHAMPLPDEALVDAARDELHSIMGLEAQPVFTTSPAGPIPWRNTRSVTKSASAASKRLRDHPRPVPGRQRLSRHRHPRLRPHGQKPPRKSRRI